MRTRCPACQTVFRVTTEQIRVRVGKVRCGHCKATFNALDNLFGENMESPLSFPDFDIGVPPAKPPAPEQRTYVDTDPLPPEAIAPLPQEAEETGIATADKHDDEAFSDSVMPQEPHAEPELPEKENEAGEDDEKDGDETAGASTTEELGKAVGLILPRETTEIPGYSKWAESAVTGLSLPEDKPVRWPFFLVGTLLALVLAGQAIFHYRTELAISLPQYRPWLEAFSRVFNREIPLPANVELVSIETSDLQNDTARNLLILNATLRNRASYEQRYPSLELALTDTQDTAVARRVFSPREYLPPKLSADKPFAGNSDIAVRLWINARDVGASGYRLYVFYP